MKYFYHRFESCICIHSNLGTLTICYLCIDIDELHNSYLWAKAFCSWRDLKRKIKPEMRKERDGTREIGRQRGERSQGNLWTSTTSSTNTIKDNSFSFLFPPFFVLIEGVTRHKVVPNFLSRQRWFWRPTCFYLPSVEVTGKCYCTWLSFFFFKFSWIVLLPVTWN